MSGRPMIGAVGATGPVGHLVGATGANGPCGPVGLNGTAQSPPLWHWTLTPWWAFWRPKWYRRRTSWQRYKSNGGRVRAEYEYATDRQRARQFLKETFDR